MSRADDIKRGIEALARELGEIEKFGPDVFEDETVLVIKKTFDAPRVVRVRPGVTGHKAYCHVYDATGDLDSDMSFEEILGRLCNCGADQVTTEELSPKEFTFAILKAGGRWWDHGQVPGRPHLGRAGRLAQEGQDHRGLGRDRLRVDPGVGVRAMSFLPAAERHDCRVCAVWECRQCRWRRRSASLLRPDLQFCARCRSREGRFVPVRHGDPRIQREHDEDADRLGLQPYRRPR